MKLAVKSPQVIHLFRIHSEAVARLQTLEYHACMRRLCKSTKKKLETILALKIKCEFLLKTFKIRLKMS
jgi:hypothetical protein